MSDVLRNGWPCVHRRLGAAWRQIGCADALWILALGVLTMPALAQTVTERAFLEDLPVVLSASRIPQSLAETPGAVTVLDREFILATGYRDIPSLLRLVPGIQVVVERGGLSQVTYHGLGGSFPNRMQVLIDGRSVYSPYFLGGVDWWSVPVTIDEIERIEVFRGANSVTYGSNAFMGVVNIVTLSAGDRSGGEFSFSIGNNSLRDWAGRFETRNGDLGLRFSAEMRSDDGLQALVDSPRRSVGTVRLDYQHGTRDTFSVWAGVNESRRVLGFEGIPTNSNGLRALRAENSFVHVQWRRALAPGEELKVGYYHNEEHAKEEHSAYLPPLFPVVPIDYNRTSDRDNLDFQHLFSPLPGMSVAWGAELRRDSIRSPRLFFGTGGAHQSLARVFGNLEWEATPVFSVNAGAMLERYSGRGSRLAPRLFGHWTPVRGHSFRVGHSVAYRAPSSFEEHADMRFYSNGYSGTLLQVSWRGSPAIRPERIRSDELGYVGQFRRWNGVLDVRVFRERVTDLIQDIVIPPLPGVLIPRTFSVVNSDVRVRNTGFEAHYSARPTPRDRLSAGYSSLRVSAPFADADHEREFPRYSATATWMRQWNPNWSTTLSLIASEHFEWSGSLPVPGYEYVDARIAYRFGQVAAPMEIALNLRNLGRKHEEFSSSAGSPDGKRVWRPVPRLAVLTLKLPF